MPSNFISTIGFGVIQGSYPFGAPYSWPYNKIAVSQDIQLGEVGALELPARAYSRPEELHVSSDVFTVDSETAISQIVFYTRGGAVMGRLYAGNFTDVEFTKRRGNCITFKCVLPFMPEFEIPPMTKFSAFLGSNPKPLWSGRVSQIPQKGTSPVKISGSEKGAFDTIKLEGYGLGSSLTRTRREGIFEAGTDMGEIVYIMIRALVDSNQVPFNFNPGKIARATGTVLISDANISRATTEKILNWIAGDSFCDWGVDSDFDFFFLPRREYISKVMFEGYDFEKSQLKLNPEAVRNAITLKRQKEREPGWTFAAQAFDETSVAKFDVKQQDFTVPALIGDHDAERYAERLLDELKDAPYSIQLQNVILRDNSDPMPRGIHRVVASFQERDIVLQECDNLSTASMDGDVGDAILSLDRENLHDGAGAFKIAYKDAAGARLRMASDFDGQNLKTVTIWIQPRLAGLRFNLALGDVAWDERKFPFKTVLTNRFYPVTFNVADIGLDKIKLITLEILDNAIEDTEVWIDSITANFSGNPSFEQESENERYKFGPGNSSLSVDYGPIPSRIQDYIKNILDMQKELEIAVDEGVS